MKNNRTFLEKLLDGVEVQYEKLSDVLPIKRGKRVVRNELDENGIYPVYQNSLQPLGYFNNKNCEAYTTFIIAAGAAGEIGFSEVEFWAADDCYYFECPKEVLNNKFLYYVLMAQKHNLLKKVRKASIPRLGKDTIEKLSIPIPPLSVQTEIVQILDTLTALTSELTSELTLRRKQYEYYREKLLSHNDSENSSQQKVDKDKLFSTSNIQWLHLNEIYKFQYGIGNKIPTIGGEYPVYGSNGIVGSHYEYNSEDAPVIGHIGAYAGIVNWAEGKHFVTYNGIICNKINDNVNSRYAYYLLLSQNFIDKANKASQPFISYDILNKCIVPVPPIGEQQRIVSILDKFETLTNSITEGLPLAIEQNQKRYEYYRELLLNFPGRE